MSEETERVRVAAVLFPGFNLLDLYGPLELFGMAQDRTALSTLAESPGWVPSAKGPAGFAEAALAGAPFADVLLVPGGEGTRREVGNAAFLSELQRHASGARFVASVCTGSALLAKAGILDGRRATTNKRAFAWAASQGPRVSWVPRARWVEDGPIFTSSGVSAGMDMALGLLARLFGRAAAVDVANRAEYEWHEDSGADPFAAMNGL